MGLIGEWFSFLIWFCFEQNQEKKVANPTAFKDHHVWDVLAFSNIAAIAFMLFSLLGLLVEFNRSLQAPSADGRPAQAWGKLILLGLTGAIAAFLVAIIASFFNMLQLNVQSAVVAGVAWQVIYANLLERINGMASSVKAGPPEAEKPVEQPNRPETEGH